MEEGERRETQTFHVRPTFDKDISNSTVPCTIYDDDDDDDEIPSIYNTSIWGDMKTCCKKCCQV